ncbi:MAG: hypothetical protein D6734_06590 [Candidatus Schekmanbacteria bacterium]|nr:MAG: hypothetical protein D6734_06590 [Candidatus Schekmanbacteria bacterium]
MRLNKSITIFLILFFCSYNFLVKADNKSIIGNNSYNIEENEKELKKLLERKKVIEKEIEKLNSEIQKMTREAVKYKKEFNKYRNMAERLEKEIYEREKELPDIKQKISKYLRIIYMRERVYPLRIIYASKNYLNMIDVLNTVRMISLKEMEKFNNLKNKVSTLKNDYKKLQDSIENAKDAYNKVRLTEKGLIRKRRELSYALSLIQKNSEEYREKISKLKEKSSSNKEKIAEKEETEKEEKGRFSYIIDKNKIENQEYAGLIYEKGKIMWPLRNISLVESGEDANNEEGINSRKGGVIIKSRMSKAVQSVYEGKVIYSAPYLEYQNIIIIDHGYGYYTVYGFDGQSFVNKGQKVYTGKVLGKINVDREGFAKLYFQINLKGKPLNPFEWLEREQKVTIK